MSELQPDLWNEFKDKLAALCNGRKDDASDEMDLIRACGPAGGVHPSCIPTMIEDVLSGHHPSYVGPPPPRPHDMVSRDFWMRVADLCNLRDDARRRSLIECYRSRQDFHFRRLMEGDRTSRSP